MGPFSMTKGTSNTWIYKTAGLLAWTQCYINTVTMSGKLRPS